MAPLRDYILPDGTIQGMYVPDSLGTAQRQIVANDARLTVFEPGERLRRDFLPANAALCPFLLPNMHLHLKHLLTASPTYRRVIDQTPDPITQFRFVEIHNGAHTFPSTSSCGVDSLPDSIFHPVSSAFTELTGRSIARQLETPDPWGKVLTPHTIHECDTANDLVHILWETHSAGASGERALRLHERLAAGAISLTSHAAHSWGNDDAIIARIAWQAMALRPSTNAQPTRWAIVSWGSSFFAVLILADEDRDGVERVSLLCSPIYKANDKKFPITSVALYMALSYDLATRNMMTSLGIDKSLPILACSPLPRHDAVSYSDPKQLRRAALVQVRIDSPSYESLTIHRVSPAPDAPSMGERPLRLSLDPSCVVGSVGSVYRSGSTVFKISTAEPHSILALKNEAKVYERLEQLQLYLQTPRYYGLFKCGSSPSSPVAVALSYEGGPTSWMSIDSWDSLTKLERQVLYHDLKSLHGEGIIHGDFQPQHVLRGPHGLCVVDFAQADLAHECLGLNDCVELIEACDNLLADTYSSDDESDNPLDVSVAKTSSGSNTASSFTPTLRIVSLLRAPTRMVRLASIPISVIVCLVFARMSLPYLM